MGERENFLTEYLLLGFVALVALALRVYGIDFGLPLHYHIDETRVMSRVMRMVTTGDLNPHFFHYPSFIFYFISLLVTAYYGVHFLPFAVHSLLRGRMPAFSGFRLAFTADDAVLYQIGRISMAVCGVLTVILVYLLVKRLFSQRAAVFASLALSIAPLHVLESHYIKQEIMMTLFMVLALYIGVRGMRSSGSAPSCGVGAASGLAASVKYNGILSLTIVPMLFRKARGFSLSSFIGKGPLKAAVVAVLVLLVTSPYIVLDFGRFRTDFAYEMLHVSEKGHPGFDLNGAGIVYHRVLYQLLAAFPFSLGLPLYLLSLSGVVLWISRKEEGALWMLWFMLPYFLVTSAMKVVFLRYYMPLLVGLCIASGYAYSVMASRKGAAGKLARAGAAAVILYTCLFTWSLEKYMPRGRSTLDDALVYVQEHIPAGKLVAFTHFTPPLQEGSFRLLFMRPEDFTRKWLEEKSPDCIITSRLVTVGFERGGEGVEEGRRLIEGLRSGKYGYRRVAYYSQDFLNRSFYERLDPTFGDTFMPGIEIFVKEDVP